MTCVGLSWLGWSSRKLHEKINQMCSVGLVTGKHLFAHVMIYKSGVNEYTHFHKDVNVLSLGFYVWLQVSHFFIEVPLVK